MEYTNQQIVSLIDLTSLNLEDSIQDIDVLCNLANNNQTAAICIYSKFISHAKNILNPNIEIATVINFPSGEETLQQTLQELDFSQKSGATEIDLVMPYKRLLDNDINYVENFVAEIKKNTHVTLKIIIESGCLQSEKLIKLASKIAINNGADFIKTSTGKVDVNATVSATKYMCEEIKNSGAKCGFKAAGGVKTKEEAVVYLDTAKEIMGSTFISKSTFRFGASSLLNNLIGKKSNSTY